MLAVDMIIDDKVFLFNLYGPNNHVLSFFANIKSILLAKNFDYLLWCDFFFFVYLGFYVAFNTVQVISRRVVGRAEETSTYSSLGFCTVNCRPTASNYQLSHLRP